MSQFEGKILMKAVAVKCEPNREQFDLIYDQYVLGSPFLEFPDYYLIARERYWQSLKWLCKIGLYKNEHIIEFGGGQLAVIIAKMFDMSCTVADINSDYRQPIDDAGLNFVIGDLTKDPPIKEKYFKYDVVIILEVIEHIPEPAYVVFKRIKSVLKDNGKIYLTTPNLFRIRNICRMILGKDYLDRFMLPLKNVGLGHQLEYSANHLEWQFNNAGFEVTYITEDMLGTTGHSVKARFFRAILSPLYLRKRWKEELVAMAQMI